MRLSGLGTGSAARMRPVNIIRSVAGVVGLGLAAGSCALGGNVPVSTSAHLQPTPRPAGAVSAVVVLHYFSFGPAVVRIKPGQTVEWIWEDPGVPHNVTFAGFHSQTKTAGVYYHTFSNPGTYRYRCTLHQTMTGEVVVS